MFTIGVSEKYKKSDLRVYKKLKYQFYMANTFKEIHLDNLI